MNAKTTEEILHDLVSVGIMAAALFIKNPQSQAFASSIINLVQNTVLPIADGMIGGVANASK